MNNGHKKVFLPIILSLVLVIGILVGNLIPGGNGFPSLNKFNDGSDGKLSEIQKLINEYYVDSVNNEELEKIAITAMCEDLDPHTEYIPLEDLQQVNETLEGNFEGIGIQFQIEKDTLVVVVPLKGGPSEKVGIMSGDRIIKVNGEDITGKKLSTQDVMKKLKGPKGTIAKLEVIRRKVDKPLVFDVKRDKIPTYSIDIYYMLDDKTGLIVLSKFSVTTNSEIKKAISELKQMGMEQLILDLRDNTGGFLDAAVGVSNQFLNNGELIVYTEGLHSPKFEYHANSNGEFADGKLAVLINENSASASEIVAGAVQDNDRGVIVGRRSFGKGLVQQQIPLSDGSALRLTTAKYYTPSGRCIQRPFKKNDKMGYYEDYYNRFNHGELMNKDSISFADSLKYTTLRGRTVYGGGGIMPDYFVAIDTGAKYIYFNQCVNNGLFASFALDFADMNRKMLGRYKNAEQYIREFRIDNIVLDDFIEYASKNGVKLDPRYAEFNKKRIRMFLKALIGRNIFGMEAFYRSYFEDDEIIDKAMEILNKI